MKKGFTLLEILVVIVILSLFFSIAIASYIFIVNKSLKTIKELRSSYKYIYTLYSIEKAINCAKNIKINNSKDNSIIYMYTYCGMYPGFSKEVYFIKDNYLYVYAYPYILGDMTFYDKNHSIKLVEAHNLKAKFVISSPYKMVKLNLNDISIDIPILNTP